MDVAVVIISTTKLKTLLRLTNKKAPNGNTNIGSAKYGSARTAKTFMKLLEAPKVRYFFSNEQMEKQ